RLFGEHLEIALEQAARQNTIAALLYVDLDRFKLVNDSLGHPAGDAVLIQVAERLRNETRTQDLAARHSGDEFLILLRDLDPSNARGAADEAATRIHALLRRPFSVDGQEFSIDASVGAALFPVDAGSTDELLRQADMAMYASKRAGPGGTRFAADVERTVSAGLSVAGRLRHGLEHDEFELHYQPIVDIAGSAPPELEATTPFALEALIRWRDPERGLIEPDHFLPAAEEIGMVSALSDWTLQAALRQSRAWAEAGIEVPVSINLSGGQLRHELIASVIEEIEALGLNPRSVIIELTESLAMSDPDLTQAIISRLSAYGVRFALDDFGAGHSSLSRIVETDFPVEILKFDRPFVSAIGSDVPNAVLAAMVRLAGELGISPLAEGIETPEQWRFLADCGCALGQGYAVSAPLPADQIAELFAPAAAVPGP
ncbi:MAG: putative bifunctional diguanylate cyclase/phosphodiesterase, partial [Solirubrobacterales bacterium]